MTASAFWRGGIARALTRNGYDFGHRFPAAAEAVAHLPAHSFVIEGEMIVTNENGLAVFDLIAAAATIKMKFLLPSTSLS